MSLRWIMHVDMDAFYASIEQRDRPELRGKPVIVGGTPEGRGVVSAASYEARTFGVHSAMPAIQAVRLCPGGVFLPVDMPKYSQVSRELMSILHSYSPLVEKLSVDEAFLDLTGTERVHNMTVEQVGWHIKNRICGELHLTASAGLAPNMFLAKLASEMRKPDGYVVVRHDSVSQFLNPLQIEALWGVGKATSKKLREMGVTTVGMLAQIPEETLTGKFGEVGRHLHQLSRGMDDREVVPHSEAKSISAERTFGQDTNDWDFLETTLLHLSEEVARRLRDEGFHCKTVVLKMRFGDFKTITRNRTLPKPTCVTHTIFHAARELFALGNPNRRKMRLIGVGVVNLVKRQEAQLGLFDDAETKMEKVETALDAVRKKFGDKAIRRGRLMQ
ncbi:MAG: DNA polymerase IV [Armatimonadetes bacterium CG_4_9_14_3_um_filter_58_7]|nr:MAG: DNA polymerase IV [Armatimonadetes bacterium CG_4_9_14_3_um_filter_58_7]